MNAARKQVAAVVGATSKWQADGRNTKLAHGKVLDDRAYPRVMMRTLAQVLTEEYSEHGVLQLTPFATKPSF